MCRNLCIKTGPSHSQSKQKILNKTGAFEKKRRRKDGRNVRGVQCYSYEYNAPHESYINMPILCTHAEVGWLSKPGIHKRLFIIRFVCYVRLRVSFWMNKQLGRMSILCRSPSDFLLSFHFSCFRSLPICTRIIVQLNIFPTDFKWWPLTFVISGYRWKFKIWSSPRSVELYFYANLKFYAYRLRNGRVSPFIGYAI